MQFARNIDAELNGENIIIAVIDTYSGADTRLWTHQPDFEINQPLELLKLINNFTYQGILLTLPFLLQVNHACHFG